MIIPDESTDIEKGPAPKPNSYTHFSICDWNLDSISAQNFLKFY